jgi:hypothetical protein
LAARVGARSIAVRAVFTVAAGLLVAGLWARRTRDEGDSLGTLVDVTAALNVNAAPLAAVNVANVGDAPPPPAAAVIDDGIDYAELARRALGSPCPTSVPACTNHWDTLTGDQQQELFDLLQRVAAKIVQTQRASHDQPRPRVRYVVRPSDHRRIDVVTEGSSLTKNLYDQLHRMLTTPEQGYPFLVLKLERKLARK